MAVFENRIPPNVFISDLISLVYKKWKPIWGFNKFLQKPKLEIVDYIPYISLCFLNQWCIIDFLPLPLGF
jgi:hypothetical protein